MVRLGWAGQVEAVTVWYSGDGPVGVRRSEYGWVRRVGVGCGLAVKAGRVPEYCGEVCSGQAVPDRYDRSSRGWVLRFRLDKAVEVRRRWIRPGKERRSSQDQSGLGTIEYDK